MEAETKKQFGIAEPDYYNYLNMHSCYKVEDTDDSSDYVDTLGAMTTMEMSPEEQSEVLQIVSGILHLGNIMFREEGSERAVVEADERKIYLRPKYPKYLKYSFSSGLSCVPAPDRQGLAEQEVDLPCDGVQVGRPDRAVGRHLQRAAVRGDQGRAGQGNLREIIRLSRQGK